MFQLYNFGGKNIKNLLSIFIVKMRLLLLSFLMINALLVMHLQAITSSGVKKGELFLADVSTQLKNKNITTDVKVDTNSNVSLCLLFVS